MTATTATARGRTLAERDMIDACVITAASSGTDEQVYDPATDTYLTPDGAARYTGKCRVKPTDNADRVVETGAQSVSLWPYRVSVPMSATTIELNDLVVVTSSPLDPSLVGLRLRVRQVSQGTYLTARRLGCEVQSA